MSIKEDVEKLNEKVEQTSFAYSLLQDFKLQNKRQFIIILVILGMWFATIGYLVYVLNDIGVIEETTEVTQDNENGYNNFIGNDGEINYGRRGYDMKYRGDDSLDRMAGEYGRYMESRERYGANSGESDKSFMYMVKALEDFVMVLKEEAESPAQKQQLMQALQNSMR